MTRHRIIDRPDYLAEIDEYRRPDGAQFLLAHVRVFVWTKDALKSMISDWKLFRQIVKAPLFVTAEEEGPKWEHFVSLLGFRPHSTVICNNGESRSMFIHEAH